MVYHGRMARYEDWQGRVTPSAQPTRYRPLDPETGRFGERRLAEPHEMTREEFERDPDTLWHATPAEGMGDGVIHFGSQKAAYQAVTANIAGGNASGLAWQPGDPIDSLRAEIAERPTSGYGGPKEWHAEQPSFIALRVAPEHEEDMIDVHEELDKPFNGGDMGSDEDGLSGDAYANSKIRPYRKLSLELGDVSDEFPSGYWYQNEAEDTGSVSGVVPHKSWLWTHEQFLTAAIEQGLAIDEDVLAGYPHLEPRVEIDDTSIPYSAKTRIRVGGREVGRLHCNWSPRDPSDAVIVGVRVDKEWRRRGLATQMFEAARERWPDLRHNPHRTDVGKAWASSLGRPELTDLASAPAAETPIEQPELSAERTI
jgi:GNAT superfamily N-acetyltransferase